MGWDWSAFFQFLEALVGLFGTLASLLIGFGLGLVAALWEDWRKTRKRHRQIATALVYDIRRVMDGLKEQDRLIEKTGKIFYWSEFQQGLFEQAQADLAETSGAVYVNVSAFYAQLRNANYLSIEIQKLDNDRQSDSNVLTIVQNAGLYQRIGEAVKALHRTVKSAIGYGQDALDALQPYADRLAYTMPQPIRHRTETEKAALGLDQEGKGSDVPEGQAQP